MLTTNKAGCTSFIFCNNFQSAGVINEESCCAYIECRRIRGRIKNAEFYQKRIRRRSRTHREHVVSRTRNSHRGGIGRRSNFGAASTVSPCSEIEEPLAAVIFDTTGISPGRNINTAATAAVLFCPSDSGGFAARCSAQGILSGRGGIATPERSIKSPSLLVSGGFAANWSGCDAANFSASESSLRATSTAIFNFPDAPSKTIVGLLEAWDAVTRFVGSLRCRD
jgi:hypothetical protein